MLGITLSVSFHPGATGAGLFSMSRVHVKVPRGAGRRIAVSLVGRPCGEAPQTHLLLFCLKKVI